METRQVSWHPHIYIYTGWWFEPLWKILVNWDDYSQYVGKIKNVPNRQPDIYIYSYIYIYAFPSKWSKPLSPHQKKNPVTTGPVFSTGPKPVLELHVVFHEFLRQARHALLQHVSQLAGESAARRLLRRESDRGMVSVWWDLSWDVAWDFKDLSPTMGICVKWC